MTTRPSLLSLILLLGAPLIVALSSGALVSPGPKPVITGQWQLAFEKNFDKQFALREAALTTWGAVQYALFREGREGVLIGKDGWLFSTEEFSWPPHAAPELEAKLTYIKDVQQQLAAKNIALVIALLPDKSRLYPEYLGRYIKPAVLAGRYQDFRAKLQAAGLIAPDIEAALQSGKSQGPVFLKTDTHWTPTGANLAAQAIAQATPQLKGNTNFTTSTPAATWHEGDLLKFIPLGPLATHYGLAGEELASPQTSSADTGGDLLGDAVIPGALVGTSYSANEKWNFIGALKQALGQDFINVAADGKGPLVPMRDYLSSASFKNSPPQFIVWEIPERFLGVIYSDENNEK